MKLQLRLSLTLLITGSLGLWSHNAAAAAKPIKVFILAGQSNMQGHAHVRTFPHIGMDPETAPLLQEMQDGNGSPRVCEDVWISSLSSGGEKQGQLTVGFGANEDKIGPEFTFGITLQKIVGEPILIIKTAWGGKSLNTDFRPPSAGPYVFTEAQLEGFRNQGKDLDAVKAAKVEATGQTYRLMMNHLKKVLSEIEKVVPAYDAGRGYELAGFVWFQGWNDMVDRGTYPTRDKPGGYDAYSEVLAHFIRDVRKDLSAPGLPFVIGVIGVGGPVETYLPDQQRYRAVHQNMRSAMAAPADLPEFKGTVAAVLTEQFWDLELTALMARDATVKREVKKMQSGKTLSGADAKVLLEERRAQEFSDHEREILAKGISNQAYHYLGSAKIMAGIGKGFAEATAAMMNP